MSDCLGHQRYAPGNHIFSQEETKKTTSKKQIK